MAHVEIKIDVGNSAFKPDMNFELARILSYVAHKLQDDVVFAPFPLMDLNGNTVGMISIKRNGQDVKRLEDICGEIESLAGELYDNLVEDGGRTTYCMINQDALEELASLVEELQAMKGEKLYE